MPVPSLMIPLPRIKVKRPVCVFLQHVSLHFLRVLTVKDYFYLRLCHFDVRCIIKIVA